MQQTGSERPEWGPNPQPPDQELGPLLTELSHPLEEKGGGGEIEEEEEEGEKNKDKRKNELTLKQSLLKTNVFCTTMFSLYHMFKLKIWPFICWVK